MDTETLMKLLQGDDDAPAPKLTDIQIATRLKEVWAKMEEAPTKFTPGDLVRHKFPSMSSNKFVEMPGLFMRYLDEPFVVRDRVTLTDVSDAAHTAMTETYDCEILHLLTHGDQVKAIPFLADSRVFEGWIPESDKGAN